MYLDHLLLFYLVLLLICSLGFCDSPQDIIHKRFEYKYSFKGPHLTQKDNSIPFWEYGGSALASPEQVRITPSLRSKKGFVWTKSATNFETWELEVAFRVTGRGRIGADGLALWFTQAKGVEGDVFGSSDQWNGLGIFFDSFDNDGLQNNPYISAVVNDGTKSFNHQSDGRDQQIAGCLKDFRNKPYPVKAKVEYFKNVLTVSISNGLSKDDNYEICLRSENIFLPSTGYFGMSAATGGLADDHDVLAFNTFSLTDPVEKENKVAREEQERYEKEYQDYQKKLEDEKKKFREEHPDEARPEDLEDDDMEKWYESPQARELRQIFDGQTDIQHTIRLLHKKVDEIQVRQDSTLNQVLAASNKAAGREGGGGDLSPQQIQTLMDTATTVSDIKRVLGEVRTAVANYGVHTQDLKDFIKNIIAANKPQCPSKSGDCLTSTTFMIMLILQALVLIGYLIYKDNKEARAKKFY